MGVCVPPRAKSKEECSFDYYFDHPGNNLDSTQANFIAPRSVSDGKGVKGLYLASPCKVSSCRPNHLGLHDMNGNVRQFVRRFI